jgi:proteasome accessory factor C
MASLVGLPPYTPDTLVDVFIEGGIVYARPSAVFRRPPTLSAGEGVAVLAAGRALLDIPGADPDGALAAALDKLESTLGGRVAVDVAPPPLLDDVRRAAAEGHRLEVDYYTAYRDEVTTRTIDPHVVFLYRNGRWYVDAYDHQAGPCSLKRKRKPGVSEAYDGYNGGGTRMQPDVLLFRLHLKPHLLSLSVERLSYRSNRT